MCDGFFPRSKQQSKSEQILFSFLEPYNSLKEKDMSHIFEQRIYTQHTDCQGIVYHANYFVFLEYARAELLRQNQHPLKTLKDVYQGAFVVTNIKGNFKKPAHIDDLIQVHTKVLSATPFSLLLQQDIIKPYSTAKTQAVPIGSFSIKLAWVTLAGKLANIPTPLKESFLQSHAT